MKKKVFLIIIIIVFILFSVLAIITIKNNSAQIYSEPAIFLPKTGGYIEAWKPVLAEIQEVTKLQNICIRTYESKEEIEKIIAKPKAYNVIFIEMPVSGIYDNKKIATNAAVIETFNQDFFVPAIMKEIKDTFEIGEKNKVLPLSFDPWIFVEHKNIGKAIPSFEVAIPGKDSFTNLAVLALEMLKTDKDTALKNIAEKSNSGFFQMNAFSYSKNDAIQMVLNNIAKATIILFSDFIKQKSEIKNALSIDYLKNEFASKVTVAIFPNYKDEKMQNVIKVCQTLLQDSKITYKVTKERNALPARIDSFSFDMTANKVRNYSRNISTCVIPSLLYKDKAEYEELVSQEIVRALKTYSVNK